MHESAGRFEVELFAFIFPVVHDAGIGQRSPNGCELYSADLVVYDLVPIQEVETVGPRLTVHDNSHDPRFTGDFRFGSGDELGGIDRCDSPSREDLNEVIWKARLFRRLRGRWSPLGFQGANPDTGEQKYGQRNQR